ncbi:MAG: molybdenum cofactor guanylyltransferase [Candidatus Altiarchaeota archaeon]
MDALMLMGEATRLPDKPFLDFHCKPLFRHGWEVLSGLFDDVLVSCTPGVEDKLKAFNVPYVVDADEAGPLSGIRAGFQALSSEYVFVAACDIPFLNREVIELMQGLVRLNGLVPRHPDGMLEPLHAFYHREKTLETIQENQALRNPRQLIGKLDMVVFDTELLREVDPELSSFVNVNTREELDVLN